MGLVLKSCHKYRSRKFNFPGGMRCFKSWLKRYIIILCKIRILLAREEIEIIRIAIAYYTWWACGSRSWRRAASWTQAMQSQPACNATHDRMALDSGWALCRSAESRSARSTRRAARLRIRARVRIYHIRLYNHTSTVVKYEWGDMLQCKFIMANECYYLLSIPFVINSHERSSASLFFSLRVSAIWFRVGWS